MVLRGWLNWFALITFMLAGLMASAGPGRAEPTVFAAASLKTALDAALEAYEDETGQSARAAYGGSSLLARQIELGAPADLFFSASVDWMDKLELEGLISSDSRQDLLGNSLVVIAPDATAEPLDLPELPARLGDGRLAMALVNAVPAGIYGKAALETAGIWDEVAPRVAQSDNVRAALALVASGEAPFGIVYATDAQAEPLVEVVSDISPKTHPEIRYPVALLTNARSAGAESLLAFLTGPEAAAHFTAQGFSVLVD